MPTYDFAKFSQKLHEIERIWALSIPHAPVDPPMPLCICVPLCVPLHAPICTSLCIYNVHLCMHSYVHAYGHLYTPLHVPCVH